MTETAKNRTTVERASDREMVVTRVFDAPLKTVFDAWSKPGLFQQWWPPKSSGVPMLACEMDVRTGGGYRITFGHDHAQSMTFFGTYVEVTAPSKMVWTNEESDEGAVTTVTFEAVDGGTKVVMRELYPTKQALDQSYEGMEGGAAEQHGQLDELLAGLAA